VLADLARVGERNARDFSPQTHERIVASTFLSL
jgi:hypothetical protein